jgi:hypothetical protein
MDVGVSSVQIAQRLLNAPVPAFEDKPTVLVGVEPGPGHGEAQLKRHVEARSAGRIPIQLNPGEIVNRIPAALYQRQDAL